MMADVLARHVLNRLHHAFPDLACTRRKVTSQIQLLLDRGLLQTVTSRGRREMAAVVSRYKCLKDKPLLGYPAIGSIDFTPTGVNAYLRLRECLFRTATSNIAIREEIRDKAFKIVSNTRELLQEFAAQLVRDESIGLLSEAYKIGKWSSHWWRCCRQGWCIDAVKSGEKRSRAG